MQQVFKGAKSGAGEKDEEVFGSAYNQRVVGKLMPYILPHKTMIVIGTLSMLIYVGTQLTIPWLIKIGIDRFISDGNSSGLTWLFVLFLGVALINWGSNYLQELAMAKVGQRVLFGLRRHLFSHLQKLSLSFYDKTQVGRIISRVQGDVTQLQEFSHLVVLTTGDLLSLIGIVAVLLVMNLKLGLISIAILPILIILMGIWQKHAKKTFLKVREAAAIVNGSLNENIAGVRVVQSMNRQYRNLHVFDNQSREVLKANLQASKMSTGLVAPIDILTAISIGIVIFLGSKMIGNSQLEVGTLIAFILYIQRFFDPIRALTMQYTQFQRSMASGERIFEVLGTVPELTDAPDAKALPPIKGEIEFRKVKFSYTPGDIIVEDINLHIHPGEIVAIVGPTGAGKTTLISLVSRLYDLAHNQGGIFIDGQDIRNVTRKSLASQMSVVLQDPFLFSGTVKENIRYNNQNSSISQVMEAAKAVGAHDFIMDLENGYDTHLQERGGNISVGQQQLLSFARAIVANPRILILDEATANIDSHSEMMIQKALQKLLKGRTSIVIAHRLSTIRDANKIIVLDRGKIVEQGQHKQLILDDGLYAQLYNLNYSTMEQSLSKANKNIPERVPVALGSDDA